MNARAGFRDGTSVNSPISPASSAILLYVPRAHIVIPYVIPIVSYYLNEDGIDRFLTEDDVNLLILES